jgi:hypothetical protein
MTTRKKRQEKASKFLLEKEVSGKPKICPFSPGRKGCKKARKIPNSICRQCEHSAIKGLVVTTIY